MDSEVLEDEVNETEDNGILTPVKAIRAKCLDCCCGSSTEVKLCPCTGCPLYPYRTGHNPNRKGRILTEEQKKEIADRLSQYRKGKNEP